MNKQNLKLRTINTATEEELQILRNLSCNDPWKPLYHIHPQFGLLNDPNGLAYYNGEYHAFYQWFPFDAIHGMKHWAHVKSKDLANWERLDVGITPLEEYEKNGAYSGAALEVNGNLYLYYTGNVKYDDGGRTANQCLAIMTPDGNITKCEKPVIEGVPAGYTGHVRDPKVFRKGDKYYMLLGAQRQDETGSIIVYHSDDAMKWAFLGELNVPLDDKMIGFMWECPDYYAVDGKDILVFSPQGVEAEGYDYHNIYNVIYVLGKLNIEQLTFEIESYKELDKGFDFYAPQSFEGENKERIMFGWAGLPEVDYPSDKHKWAHCLTLPRQMHVENGKLMQLPAKQLQVLRGDAISRSGVLDNEQVAVENNNNVYELNLEISEIEATTFQIDVFASEQEKLQLRFDRHTRTVTLDRSQFEHSFALNYGTERSENVNINNQVEITIFADKSIAEIYINGGEVVFTTRIFPLEQSMGIALSANGKISYCFTKHELKQAIEQ